MKNIFGLLCLCALGFTASQCVTRTGEQTQTSALEANPWDDSLKKHFSPDVVVKLKTARAAYDRMTTAEEMATFYLVTLDSVRAWVDNEIRIQDPTEYSGDDTPDVHWSWFDEFFPPIVCAVLCSECEYGTNINLRPLADKAKQTKGNEDDLFFLLALTAYADESSTADIAFDGFHGSGGNSGGWYTLEGCDVCGASMLGSGFRSHLMDEIQKAAPARRLFGSVIDNYITMNLALDDLRYHFSKDSVLRETDALLKHSLLTTQQRTQLQEDRNTIDTNIEIQFGCCDGHCSWE